MWLFLTPCATDHHFGVINYLVFYDEWSEDVIYFTQQLTPTLKSSAIIEKGFPTPPQIEKVCVAVLYKILIVVITTSLLGLQYINFNQSESNIVMRLPKWRMNFFHFEKIVQFLLINIHSHTDGMAFFTKSKIYRIKIQTFYLFSKSHAIGVKEVILPISLFQDWKLKIILKFISYQSKYNIWILLYPLKWKNLWKVLNFMP